MRMSVDQSLKNHFERIDSPSTLLVCHIFISQVWETVEPYMLKYQEEEMKSRKLTGDTFPIPDSPTGRINLF